MGVKTIATLCLVAGLAPPLPLQAAEHPHEHGVVRLDVAVEAHRITLQLESPLDNLVGFERAPRTDAERQRVQAALARLRAADRLFVPDAAAQCRLAKVELESPALGLGGAPAPADPNGHADLDTSIEFECTDATRAGALDVGLFEAFPRMQRIDVQAVTPTGQFKAVLKRPERRLPLVRRP
jgi:hypothetical protein